MITEYNKKYTNECIDIFMDNYANPPFCYDWMERGNIERYFSDLERTPNFFGFVFFNPQDRNEIVGMCFGVINDYFKHSTYDIKEIIIKRGLQGKGLGSMALSEIETILKNAGVVAVTLYTNNDIPALGFYKKNGYENAPKAVMLIKSLMQ